MTTIKKEHIDINLLHKKNVNECFLKTCNFTKPDAFFASALSPEHHYYDDHICSITDLIYLLECGRQAETYIVHAYYGQPLDTHFILSEWGISYLDSFKPVIPLCNKEINLIVNTTNTRKAHDTLFSQDYHIIYHFDGCHIASAFMKVKYMRKDAYQRIRSQGRSELIFSNMIDRYAVDKERQRVPAINIWRNNQKNSIINFPKGDWDKHTFFIASCFNNPAYFDHTQDHYPAMVLMEAGKQACQVHMYKNGERGFPIVTKTFGQFSAYAEFNSDVKITVDNTVTEPSTNKSFSVYFYQNEKEISNMKMSFSINYS